MGIVSILPKMDEGLKKHLYNDTAEVEVSILPKMDVGLKLFKK